MTIKLMRELAVEHFWPQTPLGEQWRQTEPFFALVIGRISPADAVTDYCGRVVAGPFATREAALAEAETLISAGYSPPPR